MKDSVYMGGNGREVGMPIVGISDGGRGAKVPKSMNVSAYSWTYLYELREPSGLKLFNLEGLNMQW